MFYSEILDKYFDSKRECREAEIQHDAEQRTLKAAAEAEKVKQDELNQKRKAELDAVSKEKKALSDAIDEAKQKVTEAEQEYELACDAYKKRVAEAKEAYNKTVEEAKETLLVPAVNKTKEAQQAKYEAVKAFNDKFGTYTVKYTGDQAYNEMMKTMREFNKIFNNFWF